jgi:hypothetical protein
VIQRIGNTSHLIAIATACLVSGSCARSKSLDRLQEAEPLELTASLSGYNLGFFGRCCAFDLHLAPDGSLDVLLHLTTENGSPKPIVVQDHLAPSQVEAVRQIIEQASFFTLPPSIPPFAPDADERRIKATSGTEAHEVFFTGGCDEGGWDPPLEPTLQQARSRACSVWKAVRSLVTYPQATAF